MPELPTPGIPIQVVFRGGPLDGQQHHALAEDVCLVAREPWCPSQEGLTRGGTRMAATMTHLQVLKHHYQRDPQWREFWPVAPVPYHYVDDSVDDAERA